jgi:hypothetical protein
VKKHLLAAGALALAVAGGSSSAVSAQGTLPEIEFDVTRNAVKVAPGTQIGAGFSKITLDRTGTGETGLALVKLNPGVTVEQFGKATPARPTTARSSRRPTRRSPCATTASRCRRR